MKISVALITQNEEENIKACLESVKWADEIIIVDGGSNDKTIELALHYTQNIYKIPFVDFATQKNNALDKASSNWIFFIDADERMSAELVNEIRDIVNSDAKPAVYAVHRRTFFFGKEIYYGGVQDDYPIRLFPREQACYEQPVHEVIKTKLDVKKLKNVLVHHSTKNFPHYKLKLNCYLPFEIEVMRRKKLRLSVLSTFFRPLAKFSHQYFLKKGFLDGWTGLIYAILSSYYLMLKDFKYLRLQRTES